MTREHKKDETPCAGKFSLQSNFVVCHPFRT